MEERKIKKRGRPPNHEIGRPRKMAVYLTVAERQRIIKKKRPAGSPQRLPYPVATKILIADGNDMLQQFKGLTRWTVAMMVLGKYGVPFSSRGPLAADLKKRLKKGGPN